MALSRPKVSVVITNHNGVDYLWHCLFALKTQSYPPYEIILVDNASEDASISFIKTNYPQVKILECQENFGPAMGTNLGAKMTTGDLVAVVDVKAVVKTDWLAQLVRAFQKNWPRVGVLSSSFDEKQSVPGVDKFRSRTLNFLGNPVDAYFDDPQAAFYPEKGAILYPRFLAPDGPFDSDYFHFGEDVYLGWRFRLSNRTSAKPVDAKVFRTPEENWDEEPRWKKIYYQTRNRWLNLLLFYDPDNLLKAAPWIIGEGVFKLLASLFQGFGVLWGTLSAIVWIGFHPAVIYQKRQAIQMKRKVSDETVLRYISGRVVGDDRFYSRGLNFLSLLYCRVTGLKVLEWK